MITVILMMTIKQKDKEWMTKIIKLLLTCVVIKAIIIKVIKYNHNDNNSGNNYESHVKLETEKCNIVCVSKT